MCSQQFQYNVSPAVVIDKHTRGLFFLLSRVEQSVFVIVAFVYNVVCMFTLSTYYFELFFIKLVSRIRCHFVVKDFKVTLFSLLLRHRTLFHSSGY